MHGPAREPTTTDDDALLDEVLQFIGDHEGDDDVLTFSQLVEGMSSPLSSIDNPLVSLDAHLPNDQDQQCLAPLLPTLTSTTTSPPPSTPPSSPHKTKKRRGNPSRARRRLERLYLRDLLGELEEHLQNLKDKAAEKPQSKENANKTTENSEHSTSRLVSWQQIASRQYEQRQQSIMKNVKLKRMLEEQVQIRKSLERLFRRKRPKPEDIRPRVCVNTRLCPKGRSTKWDNHQIFNALSMSIESQYLETSQILIKAQQYIGVESKNCNVKLVRDETVGFVIVATEHRLLPFDYNIVVQEFWSCLPAVLYDQTAGVHDNSISDNLSKAQFEGHATYGRMNGTLTNYLVDRRITETDRTVFLSAGFYVPSNIDEIDMQGVYMHHKYWVVFEPGISPRGKLITKMTSYIVTTPEVYEVLNDQTRKIRTLTTFFMTGIPVELEYRQQTFENRLLHRSLHP